MKYISESKIGLSRKNNEDNLGIIKTKKTILAVICDGLGGYNAGDVASEIAVETILSYFEVTPNDNILSVITNSILESHNRILSESKKSISQNGMSTTVEVLYIDEYNIYWGHVGDSRIYSYINNQLVQLTKDHSLVQQLVDQGLINEDDASKHPNKNIITRALGDDKKLEIDVGSMQIPPGEWKFFLSTDGVTNVILDYEVEQFLQIEDLTEAAESISSLIENRGAPDNFSFIIISNE